MIHEELVDFCRAVLADCRTRSGEPWDTIALFINEGRVRAYRIGYEDGRAAIAQPQSEPNHDR